MTHLRSVCRSSKSKASHTLGWVAIYGQLSQPFVASIKMGQDSLVFIFPFNFAMLLVAQKSFSKVLDSETELFTENSFDYKYVN